MSLYILVFLSLECDLFKFLIAVLIRYASDRIKDEPECKSAMFT